MRNTLILNSTSLDLHSTEAHSETNSWLGFINSDRIRPNTHLKFPEQKARYEN